MKYTSLLLLAFSFLFQTACFKSKNPELIEKREAKASLSEVVSQKRKALISSVSYRFEINLKEARKSDEYEGLSEVSFEYKKELETDDYITLDFEAGEALRVIINDKEISDFKYNSHFLSLPSSHLNNGKNLISVGFKQKFSKTGSGLYKFTDPADEKVYIYTDFEPYDANKFAPLFDQPNLKATYQLKVEAPSNWHIITSVTEQSTQTENEFKTWSFPKSQKFSTYIFSLHAGPYKVWSDQAKLKSKSIPLKLYARQSLARYVKPDFWFKITKQGFNFFERYFSTDYPYSKYDQVIVPDFNSGAMENVAAVTFNEAYVSKDEKPLRAQRRALSNVIFHEMAHMWFGNLVTMDWWNDLWLNESFATFMAYTGLHYNTEYTESWLNFFNRTKQWGYAEDQWRTTHSIESEIPSTSVATSNFDGITYAKGASSLKQLVYLIGEDNFKKGLKDYFKDFSTKNTKRIDFISSLQKHTAEDLSGWTSQWLQTKGLNAVKSSFTCKDSLLKEVLFQQSVVSGDEEYRTHKLQLSIWSDAYIKKPSHLFPVKISGKNTRWSPSEKINCPKAIYPNWNDYGFVKVQMDEKSFDFISKNISTFDSKLFRSQFWASLRDMLKFGEIAPERIFTLIKENLKDEKDFDAASSILDLLYTSSPLFYYYSDQEQAVKDRKKLSSFLKNLIVRTTDLDLKKLYFGFWSNFTFKDSPKEIQDCLTKNCDFNLGFKLDVDKKWKLIKRLSSTRSLKKSYVTSLLKEDSSRRSLLNKLSSEVITSTDKEKWLTKALDKDSKISLKERNTILYSLVPFAQRDQYFKFTQNTFFNYINKIKDLPERTQRTFALNFSPLFCGDFSENIPITDEQVRGSDWSFSVKKALLKSLDREERCKNIKKASKLYKKEEG